MSYPQDRFWSPPPADNDTVGDGASPVDEAPIPADAGSLGDDAMASLDDAAGASSALEDVPTITDGPEDWAAPGDGAAPDEQPPVPTFASGATLGEILRAARERSGQSFQQLAATTCVRARYLKALEENDLAALPSGPYAIGYVKAYARALDLDETLAAERFKQDGRAAPEPLQPPVGVAFDEVKGRSPWMIAAVAVLVGGVLSWNVFQRVSAAGQAQPSDIAEVPATWSLGSAPMSLAMPQPAPPDQTIPALYITPGLEEELSAAAGQGVASVQGAAQADAPVQAAFNPRGAVYGAAPTASSVTIQARRAANIVVRGQDGVVYFARLLAAGEAYRAPRTPGMMVDVSEPAAFAVYLNGEYGGALPSNTTPVTQLNSRAEALARQAADEAAAEQQAALRRAAEQNALQAAAAPATPDVGSPAQTVVAAAPRQPVPYNQLNRAD
ncbi:helix-turn-helix domain-containing protein [Brevundimonas sp. 2R-24]|uniref:Helix-turn-helix domain-containing protein n=1 Tax=Peiella sedimenti TaxID=3061083 RepID=A0ABT8SR83_9CAUL|nr:helix-turn-helix domain-containing protein [Caulobacteraceae bacterium XZ-24]